MCATYATVPCIRTLSGDHHTGHGVRHTCTGREERDAHDAVGNAEREADDGDHPDHEVGEDCNPHDRVDEGHHEPSLPPGVTQT